MFEPGMLVVCIDAKPKKWATRPLVPIHQLLEKGRTYRIAAVYWPTRARSGLTGEWVPHLSEDRSLALEGVDLPPPMKGFSAYRFRKVDEATTSQALSEGRLVDEPEVVDA